jgi:hypothetical protein
MATEAAFYPAPWPTRTGNADNTWRRTELRLHLATRSRYEIFGENLHEYIDVFILESENRQTKECEYLIRTMTVLRGHSDSWREQRFWLPPETAQQILDRVRTWWYPCGAPSLTMDAPDTSVSSSLTLAVDLKVSTGKGRDKTVSGVLEIDPLDTLGGVHLGHLRALRDALAVTDQVRVSLPHDDLPAEAVVRYGN